MKPSQITPGQSVLVRPSVGSPEIEARFVRRDPRESGRPAVNYFVSSIYSGQLGPDDAGRFTMSDYDVSQSVRSAQ